MAFTKSQAMELAAKVLEFGDNLGAAAQHCRRLAAELPRGRWVGEWDDDNECEWFEFVDNAWRVALLEFAEWLETDLCAPLFTVFARGNSKLPFFSFSALPALTCPGAGDCLNWCYSFRAWRYPAAYFRQLQNTLLLFHNAGVIVREWFKIPADSVVRLYVDGDIDSRATLAFWCRQLSIRPDVRAYGYSKSWAIIDQWRADGLRIPTNYQLNLSSGSIHDDDAELAARMKTHPNTRGQFVAVPLSGQYAKGFAKYADRDYHAETREVARELYGTSRVFSCPGNCGECMPDGQHACGADKMRGVLVAIGVH